MIKLAGSMVNEEPHLSICPEAFQCNGTSTSGGNCAATKRHARAGAAITATQKRIIAIDLGFILSPAFEDSKLLILRQLAHIDPRATRHDLFEFRRGELDCAVGAAAGREYRAEPL